MAAEGLEEHLLSNYIIKMQRGGNFLKMCALLRISIVSLLMCLITFPFHCVKEEVMKMVDTHMV